MASACITLGVLLEEWISLDTLSFARIAQATFRSGCLFGTLAWETLDIFRVCHSLLCTIQSLLKWDTHVHINVFPVEFIDRMVMVVIVMLWLVCLICCLAMLISKVWSEALIEVKTWRSTATATTWVMSRWGTTTSFSPWLPTGEELFINMFEVLFEPPLATLLSPSLRVLALFLFSFSFVHIGKSRITVNVLVVFSSTVLIDQSRIGSITALRKGMAFTKWDRQSRCEGLGHCSWSGRNTVSTDCMLPECPRC